MKRIIQIFSFNFLNDKKSNSSTELLKAFSIALIIFTKFGLCLTDLLIFESDMTRYFFKFYQKIYTEGLLPYRDFDFEYPPFALLAVTFPRLFFEHATISDFRLANGLMIFVADILCLVLCEKYCRKILQMSEKSLILVRIILTIFSTTFYTYLYQRYDLLVALIIILSLFAFEKKHSNFWLIFTGVGGFFFKIVPAINLPFAFAFSSYNSSKTQKEFIILVLKLGLLTAISCVFLLGVFEYFFSFSVTKNLLKHSERGINIDSTFGSFLLFFNFITDQKSIIYYFMSFDVKGSATLNYIASNLVKLIMIIFYFYIFFAMNIKKLSQQKIAWNSRDFYEITLIVFLIGICLGKVLSPQFFIWILPLLAIWIVENKSFFVFFGFTLILVITNYIYPNHYVDGIVKQNPLEIILNFVRILILIICSLHIFQKFFKRFANK